MTSRDDSNRSYTALGIALVLAATWAIAAIVRPTATFHLAPILIVLAPLMTTAKGPSGSPQAIVGAALVALLTALGLTVADLMRGPSLLPFGDALVETVVFVAVGAVGTLAIGRLYAHGAAPD